MVDSAQAMASTAKSGAISILDMAKEWKIKGDSMVSSLLDCFSDIESREKNLRSVSESVEMRLRELEERERKLEEFKLLQEGNSEELNLKDEKLDGLLRSVNEHIERLEAIQGQVEGLRRKECEKLKEIDNRKKELDKRLNVVEMRQKEFEAKLEELAVKDEALCRKKQQFIEEVKLANKGLLEKQRLSCSLIQRLETALDTLGRMKVMMDERFEEVESRESMAHESLTAKLKEADALRESLEKRFKELEDIEKELSFSLEHKVEKLESKERGNKLGLQMVENKVEVMTQELELKQGNSESCKKEQDYEEGECRDTTPSSVIEQTMLTDKSDAHLTVIPEKPLAQQDGKKSEMVVNDPERVLELMDSGIYKILSQSPDPAKLVLGAVQGFYAPSSGQLDAKSQRRRDSATILLLGQLTKLSPMVQPCVRVAATEFAYGWKSRLYTTTTTSADPMELLGFLHLLAAFHLSSLFDKDELFSFLKLGAKQKQTPGLCRPLGLTDKVPDYIQHLINGKEFLLASAYIHEYQLQDTWKQSAILSFYVVNAKLSANTKARNQRNSFQAQRKAIGSEIMDLHIALKHINKYGLESDYSTGSLKARIEQLEADRANLRPENPPPPSSAAGSDTKKEERSKGGNKNKRKFGKECARESAMAPNPTRKAPNPPQMAPFHGSNGWYALAPPGFPHPWAYVNQVPMPHPGPGGPHKRYRPDAVWLNGAT